MLLALALAPFGLVGVIFVGVPVGFLGYVAWRRKVGR